MRLKHFNDIYSDDIFTSSPIDMFTSQEHVMLYSIMRIFLKTFLYIYLKRKLLEQLSFEIEFVRNEKYVRHCISYST